MPSTEITSKAETGKADEKNKEKVLSTSEPAVGRKGGRSNKLTLFRKAGQAVVFAGRAATIQWSALNVPMKRRKETFYTLLWLLSLPVLPMITLILVIFLLITPPLSPLMVGYMTWIFFIDKSPKTGTRKPFLSNLPVWKHVRDYFPISLIKTADLDPKRPYVFGYHPHGIISMGAMINFATKANGLDQLYPGLEIHVLTLATNFKLPFLREWLLHMGICDASKESCHTILSRGKSVLLAVGGASESLDAHPGEYTLTLQQRKGFVRVALKAGASLIPVMSFGENELWNALPNPDGSRVRNFQQYLKKKLRFTIPLIYGRGIFNYNFGLMPHRRAIITVVGEPIIVDKAVDINTEEGRKKVDAYHEIYMTKLKELFDKYKSKYAPGVQELTIT